MIGEGGVKLDRKEFFSSASRHWRNRDSLAIPQVVLNRLKKRIYVLGPTVTELGEC